jgi:uncharacterized lipoprotein YehR (DUF1307 family)
LLTKIKQLKMKKLLFVAAVAVFALSSCTKDYTCTCTVEVLGIESSSSVDYEGLSKSEADELEAACTSSSFCEWSEK